MAKPLDGQALHVYFRRLGLCPEAQELLTHIRSSPPHRTPQASYGNMTVWYPSKKMRCIIKAESHKVEFAFLLAAEHDDDVLEFWDQPPSIPLTYLDKRGRRQRPLHTADYFVFRYHSAGWVECKPTQELERQAEARPHRYHQDEQGIWRCPPGEAYAAPYGLTYQVYASDAINWVAQSNWQFLEDYYQDLEHLTIASETRETLQRIVAASPGISLADLRREVPTISSDQINIALVQNVLYVDLATSRLCDAERVLVFPDRLAARVHQHRDECSPDLGLDAHPIVPIQGTSLVWDGQLWSIANVGHKEITLLTQEGTLLALQRSTFERLVHQGKMVGVQTEVRSSLTQEGQELLAFASDADLATAVFRNRVIHPEQYDDEEQVRSAQQRAAIPKRTCYFWRHLYRQAEICYGSGFIGLLPRYYKCGGARRLSSESQQLIEEVLKTHYDTVTRKPRRGAYGEYLQKCEERQIPPTTQRTFYAEIKRRKSLYEHVLAREGKRAAYPYKDYVHEGEKTISRHGDYAWALAHIDHTELDLVLCDSRTGQPLGKCWLTLMILSHPRRIAAYYLTFDPPSYRSCLAVLRLCVKRYGRLPTAITVDGGPEFHSIYFEQLLALYRVRKQQRPAAEPRFGSPQERLFGSMETEFLYHLLGNTQATRETRVMTRATDPRRQAVWTLPRLAERLRQWADEEYETIPHPALGISPREAYELSLERDGERTHKLIPYDETFIMATFPTTRKGTALIQPGVGVRVNYLDYWCEAMRDPTVERTHVKVRYDPFDVSIGYVYLTGRWRRCLTPQSEFAGCSERELQLLAAELRERNRFLHGRERLEMTQKQLARFRRENEALEATLRQQQHDRETRAALAILERNPSEERSSSLSALPSSVDPQRLEEEVRSSPTEPAEGEHRPLLVFRRIRL